MKKENKEVTTKKNTKTLKNKLSKLFAVFTVIMTVVYLATIILNDKMYDDIYFKIITAILIFIISVFISMIVATTRETKIRTISTITLGLLLGLTTFNYYINNNVVTVSTTKEVINLNNMNLADAIDWATDHKVTIEQKYEYSDIIPLNYVIGQSVAPSTPLKDVTNILIYISSGPDLTKSSDVMDMVGWPVNDVIKYIKDNHLANVKIDYVFNNEIKKDNLISQSRTGTMKRNDELKLVFSLGPEGSLKPVKMINLVEKDWFDVNLWLKQNGFKYTTFKEFSETVLIDGITSQNIKPGTLSDPSEDEVKIGVSKGRKIVVPDLKAMTIDQISAWVVKNKLKLTTSDRYDVKIEKAKIISVNYKNGDEITEGTTIIVVKSLGQLKMIDSKNISTITSWANKYGIKVITKSAYSDKAKGSIISISHKPGQVISTGDAITITTSQGKPITVPNFVGKSKSSITSSCRSLGLNCGFVYGSYSTTAKDYATSQSISSGSKVVGSTYIKITLSKGPATSYTVTIQGAWLGGSASSVASKIKSELAKTCPGVKFSIVYKASNSFGSGYIHESSPIKTGSRVTQGKTYSIYVTT